MSVLYLICLHPLEISWSTSIFSIPSRKPHHPLEGDPLCALYLGQHYTLSAMATRISLPWTSYSSDCEDKSRIFFHFCILMAPVRECVFRRNASNDESQGLCLSSLYSFSVLPKLGWGLTSEGIVWWRRHQSQERGIWSGPHCASNLHLVWIISLLLASIIFIYKISSHILWGEGDDKTQLSLPRTSLSLFSHIASTGTHLWSSWYKKLLPWGFACHISVVPNVMLALHSIHLQLSAPVLRPLLGKHKLHPISSASLLFFFSWMLSFYSDFSTVITSLKIFLAPLSPNQSGAVHFFSPVVFLYMCS